VFLYVLLLQGDPVDDLIRNVLLEERLSLTSYTVDKYTMKWLLATEEGVVFVVIFQSFLSNKGPQFDDLLRRVRKKFMATFNGMLQKNTAYVNRVLRHAAIAALLLLGPHSVSVCAHYAVAASVSTAHLTRFGPVHVIVFHHVVGLVLQLLCRLILTVNLRPAIPHPCQV
jgi:hypothetical protein